jgi:hypothetical protein
VDGHQPAGLERAVQFARQEMESAVELVVVDTLPMSRGELL